MTNIVGRRGMQVTNACLHNLHSKGNRRGVFQDILRMAYKLRFQQNSTVIYRRKRKSKGLAGGWFSLEQEHLHARVSGFGYGDYIRLLDEFGNVWRGSAERGLENTVRYQFRDALGRSITGVSDSRGLLLRDETGRTWRGFVE